MFKLALTCVVLAAAVWFLGMYKLGDKPLAEHLHEIYRAPIVQQKVAALARGVEQQIYGVARESLDKREGALRDPPRKGTRAGKADAPEAAIVDDDGKAEASKAETSKSPRHIEEPTPTRTIIDARPAQGQPKKAPAHDTLTDDDRNGLNHLLAKKLKKSEER